LVRRELVGLGRPAKSIDRPGHPFRIDLNCFPQEIESGSGAVWFTCYFLDEVGRVAMDGTVTPFPVPNHFHGSYPDTLEGIATGAGNDMWFTEEAANRISRIRTS
jgi:virginiamycin B lyase